MYILPRSPDFRFINNPYLLLTDGIKGVSAITVAGTVLELNELPCCKNVSNIDTNLH
jgi:hypothetical protein